MFQSPAGGASELFSSPAKRFVEVSGGGGGGGLSQSQVQALTDTSLSGAVQPSSVTTSGQIKASGGFNFDTSNFPDGSESSIQREGNGGMLLKRGTTTFLT